MTANSRTTLDIELLNCDFGEWADKFLAPEGRWIAREQEGCPELGATLVVADPPWDYENFSDTAHGAAGAHYDGLPIKTIFEHIRKAGVLAGDDAYLALWCTWPKLQEWLKWWPGMETETTWRYLTGGCWGKTNGMGVGWHLRGDSEPLLLYKKGKAHANAHVSNLWLAPRQGHSEKPQIALRALIEMATRPGELVLDLYAGASGSCAKAARALGRRYLGCELSPQRHAVALQRLALVEQGLLPAPWAEEVPSL